MRTFRNDREAALYRREVAYMREAGTLLRVGEDDLQVGCRSRDT